MTSTDYRDYILPESYDRVGKSHGLDPVTYSQPVLATPQAVALKAEWARLQDEPFVGITHDGTPEPGLFTLADEGFDVELAVAAMEAMLATLTEAERAAAQKPIDHRNWRGWYNPELVFNTEGVRLENLSEASRDCFWDVLSSCTSARGFQKIRRLMKANLFLGELYDLTNIMNQWSYHFEVFGTPSVSEPWGWHIYGHHVGFNVLILGRQMVISPTFMGTEPNEVVLKSGEFFAMFKEEEAKGLALMQSLAPALRERATIFTLMEDPAMPAWRFNFADQRHLGGAFQDNRIVPVEGVCARDFTPEQRLALLDLCETFYIHWPDGPRRARMRQIEDHLDRTFFSWIGGHGDDDPFYYHIHSPVVMLEFDHHSGMWLSNTEPAKFHIHVISRIPNGNDYGRALIAAHRARKATEKTAEGDPA
ncbi:DUF3500 domain-containing protein [Paenirhodobacter populi]|uniref:DUF3500 domain-containing protein n=1 Tax=Paenirhodobacter populi TaxID=2306993 RepID=UPI000FE3DD2B|nr:DUF3500 domain-containing protein [Sinirhodobacter populi]RWR06183.1 DUF3500 domain-containing protein [Sinirhodobacter populi]